MCLSKPQRVMDFRDGFATVEFLGEKKKVKSPIELAKGDYIVSQAGMVVQKIPRKAALEMLAEWRKLNDWRRAE